LKPSPPAPHHQHSQAHSGDSPHGEGSKYKFERTINSAFTKIYPPLFRVVLPKLLINHYTEISCGKPGDLDVDDDRRLVDIIVREDHRPSLTRNMVWQTMTYPKVTDELSKVMRLPPP